MKIGIYGGSFNPIHKGHLDVAKFAIDNLKLDKLIFVPAFKSPFKSKTKYAQASDRVNMINLVKLNKMEVSLFEVNRKGVSYTIDTIEYFSKKFPNDELYLIIGSDNVYKLNKWKQINTIVQKSKIVVFKRKGEFSKINIKRYNAILLDNPLYDYASTWFRKGYFKNVEYKVMDYIAKNFLYVLDIMSNMLDAKRHKHSISVANYSARFAKVIEYSAKKAWIAGALHDITKSWSKERHYAYLIRLKIDISNIKDFELHSLTAYHWLKNEYRLNDYEILNSILKHTSLAWELTDLDKIIFSADKLADGRMHQGIQKDRQLMIEDFNAGFKQIVKVAYGILIKNKRPLSDEQIKIYERWM